MASSTLEYSPIEKTVTPELWSGRRISAEAFDIVRRQMVLECCKWDPQVGDVATLADFPLVMSQATWRMLAELAERLTAEMLAAEEEIVGRPELLAQLGLPRKIQRLLADGKPRTGARAARVMRFDFHPTAEGWRISEVNSDVPGGFTEAGSLARLMAEHSTGLRRIDDPVAHWSRAIARVADDDGTVCLLSAPGFMEDHQVIAHVAERLRAQGCRTRLAGPQQIEWRDGRAFLNSAGICEPVGAVVRFYQAEWLGALPWSSGWSHYFSGALTPICNPGTAIVTESKRFPLVWPKLKTPMPAWRELLPETREPGDAPWRTDDGWLLKSALCNTGDTVSMRELLTAKQWRAVRREVWWHPGKWVAQRRFESVALPTPSGPMHPCVGVYTVEGKAAGVYGRIAPRPLIDFAAVDVAVLMADTDREANDV